MNISSNRYSKQSLYSRFDLRGWHSKESLRIMSLEEGSRDLLDQIVNEIGSKPPRFIPPQINRFSCKGQYRIALSKERHHLLALIGESKDQLPIFGKDSEKLWPHFIRGIFDGDGCISLDKRYALLYPNQAIPGDFHILFNYEWDRRSHWCHD